MGNGGDYTNAALYLAQLQQQQQGGNSSNGGNPVSGRPSGSEQFYQPIYQQLYQNNNVDTPYGASQYGKGVQYLQNPFSYAPPGVSYGSQGGMGGMSNPFTYRGGNISANSGMGYGGYGAYGTQTPGSQTGTPPPQTGTPTGAVTTPPRSTASSAGTNNNALLAEIQAYIAGNPTATRTSVPTGTPTGGATAGPTGTPTGATTRPSNVVVGPTGGFVTGPGTTTPSSTNTPAASNYTPTAADNKAFITWWLAQPSITGKTNAEAIKSQGINDPYTNAAVLGIATDQNVRANSRLSLLNGTGDTSNQFPSPLPPTASQIAPWNDPNWEKYQGTNKEAYTLGMQAKSSPDAYAQLKKDNGWDGATAQSWILRATDPTAWNKQAAIDSANAGLVAGPGPAAGNNLAPLDVGQFFVDPTRVELPNPFTDTGTAPAASTDPFQQIYGRSATPEEAAWAASQDPSTVNNVLTQSLANWNASQNAAPAAPVDSYNGYDTGGGKRGGKVSKDGIAALLRRR